MRLERHHPHDRQLLFTFVVVADTHVNETEEGGSSPFLTNHQANARARYVFCEIAAMQPQPKFVVHLGDIVHPVPALPTFHEAVALFKDIADPLSMPLYLIPGNHDVGDKRIDWMPADHVCDDYLNTYRDVFGKDFYAFDEQNVRFLMMNSLLLNSGLDDEARQREWLEDQITQAGDKRVFVFMHYPPYIYTSDERGNYDNIDEPARSWLISQLQRPSVEALFAGHVHNFWYDKVGTADFYMLPSTAFLRHDFSEFYKVAPVVEYGRGDVERFGYFLVDVFADGHIAYSIRSMGRSMGGTESDTVPSQVRLAHPESSTFNNIGVELRHPWTESMQITATGGVQEFGRKWARNDYPLLALWEMGTRLAKVPDIDVLENESRRRMELISGLGMQFLVTTLGKPKTDLLKTDLIRAGVIGFEINLTIDGFKQQQNDLKAIRTETGASMYLSRIRSDDEARFDGKHFTHSVKAGFSVEELSDYRELITQAVSDQIIDGITIRLEANSQIAIEAQKIADFADELGMEVLVSLKLSGAGVAEIRNDDNETVAMLAQAMILSKAHSRVRYIFDTFMDVDRGYYPRHAFIDRKFNPRPAARAFTTLNALFSPISEVKLDHESNFDEQLKFAADDHSYQLLYGEGAKVLAQVQRIDGECRAIDLISDEEQSIGTIRHSLQMALADSLQVILIEE